MGTHRQAAVQVTSFNPLCQSTTNNQNGRHQEEDAGHEVGERQCHGQGRRL